MTKATQDRYGEVIFGDETDALSGHANDKVLSPRQIKRMIELFLHELDSRIQNQNQRFNKIEAKVDILLDEIYNNNDKGE